MAKTKVYLRESMKEVSINYRENLIVYDQKSLIDKWQRIINMGADILNVKAGLIMKITKSHMEVFLKSQNPENPYPSNGKDKLCNGLYCETVLGTNRELYIENALKTKVWANNPDVKINMISYLGYPIRYPNGDSFGTICVLHDEPLKLKDKHKLFLATLRDSIEKDLLLEEKMQEINLLVTKDQLTMLNNRRSIDQKIEKIQALIDRNIGQYLITMIDLNNFKSTNDIYGHSIGDKVLVEFSKIIKKRLRTTDFIGRFGGDEFIIISQNTSKLKFEKVMNCIHETYIKDPLIEKYKGSFSYGISSTSTNKTNIKEIIAEADKLMYKNKEKYKKY